MLFVAEKITKFYRSHKALQNISVTMQNGVYGLLGPNGAGKSTLLNILTGNLQADEGKLYLDGEPVNTDDIAYKKILGYVPQQQALYPDFSVRMFLEFIAALNNMQPAETEKRIDAVLMQVDLTEVKDKKIKKLSGGMKQRVLIAQALLKNPQLLILDEPTAGLDPEQRIHIRKLIAEVATDRIVLIATHIVSDVECIANDIILLDEGQVICQEECVTLLRQLKGKVWEILVSQKKYEELEKRYLVCGIKQEEGRIRVRFLSEEDPGMDTAVPATPELEDVYLWYFGEKNGKSGIL
ncbi:MAG: ATP-binding cassette domain-containing protein [Lachnospiraceae bacterium]